MQEAAASNFIQIFFRPLSDIKERNKKDLQTLHEELERLIATAQEELTASHTNKMDNIIAELESIKLQVNREFDAYINELKDQFNKSYKINIYKLYQELKSTLQ